MQVEGLGDKEITASVDKSWAKYKTICNSDDLKNNNISFM
jgi:hypothetical protein